MTYCPIMGAVLFLVRFDITEIVSVSDSAKSGSYCAIISDSGYSQQALVGVLVELRFPFVL